MFHPNTFQLRHPCHFCKEYQTIECKSINTTPVHKPNMAMSDHQDSEAFSYERSWEEIEDMLDKAERTLNYHQMKMLEFRPKSKKWVEHARNFKALQGVVKTLRWTLGDKHIIHPLD